MVNGIPFFRDHFKGFAGNYALIGGAACDIAFERAGLPFRATKDLDIVLYVEKLSPEFLKAVWSFVEKGGYQTRQRSNGRPEFFRFIKPRENGFPFMLEMFSRRLDLFRDRGGELTPIPGGEEISSLSAILLDDVYYDFLWNGVEDVDEVSFIGPEYLIPLKMRAFLDLSKRKHEGQKIDSKNIKKHKNDVFRLFQLLALGESLEIPEKIKEDAAEFVSKLENENFSLESLGLNGISKGQVLDQLGNFYGGG